VVVAVGGSTKTPPTNTPSSSSSSSSSASASASPSASSFRVGDRVYGRIQHSLAQYAVAYKSQIVKVQPNQNIREATANGSIVDSRASAHDSLSFNGVGMDRMLCNKTIYLVNGGGRIGHQLLQALKSMNNRVMSAYSRFETFMLLHEMQCDYSINYAEKDVVYEIMRYTEGKGADVVIDLLGKNETLQQSVLSLAQNGMLFMVPKPGNNQTFTSRELQSQLQSKNVTIHEAALSLDPDICCGFTISPRLFTPQTQTQTQTHAHTQGHRHGHGHGHTEGQRGSDVVVRPRLDRHKYEFTRGDVNKALTDMKSHLTTGCVLIRISS